MAKRPGSIEGIGPNQTPQSYDDDKFYSVTLKSTAEYPAGSRRYISPGGYVELRGRVVNAIKENIESATEVVGRNVFDHSEPRAKTNAASRKSVAVR